MYRLDSKPYADKVKEARRLADKALKRYEEPTMSLDELRATLDREFPGVSLSELIVNGRESGY
jgi:hypothetical protein